MHPRPPLDTAGLLPGGVAMFGSEVPRRRVVSCRIADIRLDEHGPCRVACGCGEPLTAPDPVALNLAYERHSGADGWSGRPESNDPTLSDSEVAELARRAGIRTCTESGRDNAAKGKRQRCRVHQWGGPIE